MTASPQIAQALRRLTLSPSTHLDHNPQTPRQFELTPNGPQDYLCQDRGGSIDAPTLFE